MATTTALQLDLELAGEANAPPALPADAANLCVVCGLNPRHAVLTRCLPCLRADAARQLADRAAAEARIAAQRDTLTKACRSCGKVKALADFAAHASAKDGRRKDCRRCVASGKAKVPRPSEAALAKKRALAKTPEARARNLEAVIKWQTRNAAALAAHRAVRDAIKAGVIVRPKTCQALGCKRRKKLHSHHNSYGKRSLLRVIHLCPAHHRAVHSGLSLKLKAGAVYAVARAPKAA